MSARLERARRLAHRATTAADAAWAEVARANRAVHAGRDAVDELDAQATVMADPGLSVGLRGLLATASARRRDTLGAELARATEVAGQARATWDEARTRARSFDKLVERIERRERAERDAREQADLLDVIVSRAAAMAADDQTGAPA